MDSRDQELLNEQLQRLQLPPCRDGLMILTIVGVFLAGMTTGGLVFERNRATNGFERWKDGVSLFLERLADDRAVTVPSAASRA